MLARLACSACNVSRLVIMVVMLVVTLIVMLVLVEMSVNGDRIKRIVSYRTESPRVTGLPWLVRSERRRIKTKAPRPISYWRFWSFPTTLNIEALPKFCKPLTNCFSKFITSPPPFPWFLMNFFLRFILIKLSLKRQLLRKCSPLCDICLDQRSWLSDLSTSLVFPPPGQIIIIIIMIVNRSLASRVAEWPC